MSYSCERCGTYLQDLATQCGCDLPPTDAEIARAKIGWVSPVRDALIAERDRLAAENAELWKTVAETEQACNELSDELNRMRQLELEAKCHGDLEESHKIMVDVVAERDAELAAANATLDALREAVQSDEWIYAKHTDTDGQMGRIEDILYPQPAAQENETIRAKAERLGFAPMPAELGQRSIDDHATYAALAEGNDNG